MGYSLLFCIKKPQHLDTSRVSKKRAAAKASGRISPWSGHLLVVVSVHPERWRRHMASNTMAKRQSSVKLFQEKFRHPLKTLLNSQQNSLYTHPHHVSSPS